LRAHGLEGPPIRPLKPWNQPVIEPRDRHIQPNVSWETDNH
jgi:hypothetical protein